MFYGKGLPKYQRPAAQFATYTKQEYVLPDQAAAQLVMGLLNRLLGQSVDLSPFAAYQRETSDRREMLVCTHTQVDLACGRYGTPVYRHLRQTYGQPEQSLRVWQSTHFGGHQFAPTLIDLPTGQLWGHLEMDVLPQLIHRDGDPQQMGQFYRGWTGLSKLEQIAEREAWLQTGWDWFTYPRTAHTRRKGLAGRQRWLYPLLPNLRQQAIALHEYLASKKLEAIAQRLEVLAERFVHFWMTA